MSLIDSKTKIDIWVVGLIENLENVQNANENSMRGQIREWKIGQTNLQGYSKIIRVGNQNFINESEVCLSFHVH